MNSTKDPVCGMDVSPEEAAGKMEYKGKTYYFCNEEDLQTFRKNPEEFVSQAAAAPASASERSPSQENL